MTSVLSYIAVALGPILFAEAALLVGWYWSDGKMRRHVLAMGFSYFTFVGLTNLSLAGLGLPTRTVAILVIVAELVGAVGLWMLVIHHGRGEGEPSEDTKS
jgi:hypothetical protein